MTSISWPPASSQEAEERRPPHLGWIGLRLSGRLAGVVVLAAARSRAAQAAETGSLRQGSVAMTLHIPGRFAGATIIRHAHAGDIDQYAASRSHP
jgi:hypothetical protein